MARSKVKESIRDEDIQKEYELTAPLTKRRDIDFHTHKTRAYLTCGCVKVYIFIERSHKLVYLTILPFQGNNQITGNRNDDVTMATFSTRH